MGKHSLLITISISSLILVMTIVLVLGSLNKKIGIKTMLFEKNAVNKTATIAEKMMLEKLEEDIKNWQDILVKADEDIEPSDKEVLYMKYNAKGEYDKAKEVLKRNSNSLEKVNEEDVLTYKVARRLKPVDQEELDLYQGKKDMALFEEELAYPLYKKINNIGFNANLWNVAEQIVNWGLIGVSENEDSFVVGSRTTDYQQEYPLDDYLKKINKLNLQGRVSISGDLDETRNTFVANVVQLHAGKINLYEYSLLEDKFQRIEQASIDAPKWIDAIPIITTVYNQTNKLIESFIGVYSPSKGILNLYTHSIIEDEIVEILVDCDLKSQVSHIKGYEDDVVSLELGQEIKSLNIKDVKIISNYNHNMGLPHVMLAVNGQYIYTDSTDKLQSDEIIYFYDYFPIIDDMLTISELKTRGKVDNWDTDLSWSETTKTSLLTLVKHRKATDEDEGKFEFLQAMPIIDDYFEEVDALSDLNQIGGEAKIKIKNNDIKKLAYSSFMDLASGLTKTVLVLNISGDLYQINGSVEIEEWDEIYDLEENSTGNLELAAIKGDIASIHLIDKPIAKNYFNKALEIEIAVFNQKNDTRTILRNTYDFKIYSDFDIEYETKDKKRDIRNWNDEDIGYIE